MDAQVHASLIVVLTRGGSTARLVAKYRPSIPVLTVAVPVLTTDSLTWTCSGEQPARQCLVTRGLLPLLAEGSARATDTDTTDEIISVSCPICLQLAALALHLLDCLPNSVVLFLCALRQLLHLHVLDAAGCQSDESEHGLFLLAICLIETSGTLTLCWMCAKAALVVAKKLKYCQRGDSIVALHRIGNASVIKIVDIK